MPEKTKTRPETSCAPSQSGSPLDVLVIGAGFSGVCAGIKLLKKGITNFRIFEKSYGIGGTWYDNTYPGAVCDVPSHLYCYSFEPNPNWSRVYSPQEEIQAYIEHCVDKYGIRPYITHGAKVLELRLDEDAGLWLARFEDGHQLRARHVVNGTGALHEPYIPDFLGKETFRGPTMHTARWDHTVDMAGKRVAVIGSAASAIQVTPEIAKIAKQVNVYHRTPNYIFPRGDRAYTEKQKQRFARWPLIGRLYRWFIFMRMELLLFPITKLKFRFRQRVNKKAMLSMRAKVQNPAMQEHLVPDYAMGCKRILLSDNFYQTLNRPNVELITAAVDRFEPTGIRTADGRLHDADVIVYATGFDIEGHMQSIEVFGRGGQSLQDAWSDGPEAYNGACIAGFPNYYLMTGPNTGVGTTSVLFMVEQELGYILKLIEAAGREKLISVNREAQDSYNRGLHAELQDTVWASGCKSWYRREDGKIVTLYPHNGRTFRRQLRHVRCKDFDIRPAGSQATGT